MFLRNKNRVGAVVALVLVLSLVLTAPARAAGWPVWEGAPIWAGHLLPRALAWLGLVKSTCGEQGSSIDPNGCPKALKHGSQIEPNEASTRPDGASVSADHGSSIDPDG
jgi:hypothetical protein